MQPSPRSLLYVPASSERRLRKITALAADALAIDLEDGVAPSDRTESRQRIRRHIDQNGPPAVPWMLRVNGPGSPWHDQDLDLALAIGAPAVLVPKAEDPEVMARIAARLPGRGLCLMIESARGVLAAPELAAVPAVRLLVVGSADLRRSLGARPAGGRDWERHALSSIVLAARAHGRGAVDAVYFHYLDREGLLGHARVGRELGFDGGSCIHPSQVEPLHEVYDATAEEVAWAERVLAAWQDGRGDERGVVVCDGEMVEALHVDLARRLLRRAPAGGAHGRVAPRHEVPPPQRDGA